LQTWLPADIAVGFTWGTSTVAVPENLMERIGLPPPFPYLIRKVLKKVPVIGWAVQAVSISIMMVRAWNVAVTILGQLTDDGGRLYFPTVVSEAVARILESIAPATTATAPVLNTPDILQLARPWAAIYDQSLYLNDQYRYFANPIAQDFTYTAGGGSTNYYHITLPDLVYLPGGGATMVSFKTSSDDQAVFATTSLLFATNGELMMVSGLAQFVTGSICSCAPVWADDNLTANEMCQMMVQTLFSEDNLPTIDPNNVASVMADALSGFLTDLVRSTRGATVSSAALLCALPALPSVKFTGATTLATSKQRPAVAVASSGYGVVVCVDSGGEDSMWEITISSSASGVSKSSAQSSSYQNGQDPALAMYGDSTVVEVHGGNGNNKLYYNLITLSGSSVTTPDSGENYEKGENPAVGVVGSRAYEFHRDQNAGNDTLYYEVGSISSSGVDFSGKGTSYAEGDNVCASPIPNHWNLVLGHVRNGTIYTINATVSSADASITFGDEAELCDGDGPALAVLSNQYILAFHSGSDDQSNDLCSSIGLWSTGGIQWIVIGVVACTGGFPGASRRSDDTVVVVYEANDGNGSIAGRVASLSLPDGFA
jgi:hypothetical protein